MRGSKRGRGVACGVNMQGLSTRSGPNTQSSKTSGGCSPAGLRSSCGTWPRSGTMRNGKCSPAAALGAPHHRERVFIVAYPNGQRTDAASRLLAPLRRIMGDRQQSVRVSDWLGVRFDRSRRSSAREAYRGCVLRRVDDGAPGRLDSSGGVKPLPRDMVPVWMHRLKALGNGITPQQSYAVASCILKAEGLPVPAIPHIMRA